MPVIITLIICLLVYLFNEFGGGAFWAGVGVITLVTIAAGNWDEP